MKKFLSILMVAFAITAMVACDDEENGTDTPGGDNSTLATQIVGTWQSEHLYINGEEAHMQMTIVMNADGTGQLADMEEAFSWQVSGNDVTITNAHGNTFLFTVTNVTDETLVITGSTIPGSDQEALFEGHFIKVNGGDTPDNPDPGDLGVSAPELVESTSTSFTLSAHITGNISQYLGQFLNYTCGFIYECEGPLSMDHNVVTCTADAAGAFTSTITGLEPGKDYAVAAWLKLTPESEAIISDMRVYVPGGGSNPGDENWVDLGLPSGLLWAKCNVGATTPEGYGDYFAWAETSTKTVYSWSTYRYCTADGNGELLSLTKYNTNTGYGSVDNLTTLVPSDDAATVNLGNGARTPTSDEWEELLNNTTVTSATLNGVFGRLLTAANGNTLFLPAAGARYNSELLFDGERGVYWSSSLATTNTNNPSYARALAFWPNYIDWNNFFRKNGYSVRAVRAPQE